MDYSDKPSSMIAEFGYEDSYAVTICPAAKTLSANVTTHNSFDVFRDMYIKSNSPVLSSSSEHSDAEETHRHVSANRLARKNNVGGGPEHRKLTFEDVEPTVPRFSVSEKEVLVAYLRAIKTMYLEASSSYRNNHIVFTGICILLSLFLAVFTPFVLNGIVVCCVGGVITVCHSLDAGLRFDANSAFLLYFADSIGKINTERLEEEEIRALVSNPGIGVPVFLRRFVFRFTHEIDVFRLFEFAHHLRNRAIADLVDVKNEIGRIMHRWDSGSGSADDKWKSGVSLSIHLQTKQKEENRLVALMEKKDELKQLIDAYSITYDCVIEILRLEMTYNEYAKGWGKFSKNPFIESYAETYGKIHADMKKYVPSVDVFWK